MVRLAGRLSDSDVVGVGLLVNVGSKVLLQGTALLLTIIIFLLIYKLMPNTKTHWRYIWPGAVVAGVLFELAKYFFIFYLERFTSFENVYGGLAPVIVMLLWTYLSSLILILGAELSSEYGRLRRGVDRGVLIHSADPSSVGGVEGRWCEIRKVGGCGRRQPARAVQTQRWDSEDVGQGAGTSLRRLLATLQVRGPRAGGAHRGGPQRGLRGAGRGRHGSRDAGLGFPCRRTTWPITWPTS